MLKNSYNTCTEFVWVCSFMFYLKNYFDFYPFDSTIILLFNLLVWIMARNFNRFNFWQIYILCRIIHFDQSAEWKSEERQIRYSSDRMWLCDSITAVCLTKYDHNSDILLSLRGKNKNKLEIKWEEGLRVRRKGRGAWENIIQIIHNIMDYYFFYVY